MRTYTLGELFCCGGGVGVGGKAAGLIPTFALDCDPVAVESYRVNLGNHVVCADVRSFDFRTVRAKLNILHASPSCKTSSNANPDRGETQEDIDCALATCRAIAHFLPEDFTLENVVPYRNTKSFKLILAQLIKSGYKYEYHTLNSANYGVPQKRQRLILIATREGYPVFPAPTHSKPSSQKTLFDLPDWVTWYEAITDLIPTLERTDLAPWQRKFFEGTTLFHGTSKRGGWEESFTLPDKVPAFTVKATENKRFSKIGLVGNDRSSGQNPNLIGLVGDNKGFSTEKAPQFLNKTAPAFTIKANNHYPKIVYPLDQIALIEKAGARVDDTRGLRTVPATLPVPTLKALGQDGHWQQWVVQNGIVFLKASIQCLARWQSFPSWYQFPEKKPQACSIIGNAVPPLLMQRVFEEILRNKRS